MKLVNDKVIGIVGGMGPEAGIAAYESLVNHTPATTDQEHLSVVLMSFPKNIVDRTLFLEGATLTNPAYEIVEVIKKLIISGAQVIGIACNTSHSPAIFDIITSEIEKLERKPMLLNMPLEVCDYISKNHSTVSRIGLMTTNGTYKSELYKTILEKRGYEVVIPDVTFQGDVIHRMIYDPLIGIKANSTVTPGAKLLYNEAMLFFRKRNAEAIILGCTELSLIVDRDAPDGLLVIDSTDCLARALIREAVANE